MTRDVGPIPYVLVLNKTDLVAQWRIRDEALTQWDCPILRASAKTGEGVEKAFIALTEAIVR